MLQFIFQVVIWVLCIYGFLSIINDSINRNTYKNNQENINLVMTVKNVENGIEEYIRELMCGRIFYKNLAVIDLDSEDDTIQILQKLEKQDLNIKVLKKNEGEVYLERIMKGA